MAAAVPISGLTAWQSLFDHAGLKTGQTVLIHGAAGGVGSMARRRRTLGPGAVRVHARPPDTRKTIIRVTEDEERKAGI